jgi:cellulose synthase/poly-beta-1,6-N-acetylglucosamine synthase-like glycosyltransferase
MDADNTYVKKDALKKMMAYFDNPKVMCVAPVMVIYNPKGVLQRIQQIEYLLGVFLRKSFSSMNAVHITPGAFSSYRKSFFTKHGGFKKAYLTEDLEMALRIQSNHYIIENSLNSIVYTVAPNNFKILMKQRRRWYTGLLKNLWDYKRIFSKDYGPLGVIVLPVALISITLSVILTSYLAIDSLIKLRKEILLLQSIHFNFISTLQLNKYFFDRYIFILISDPITIFAVIFIGVLLFYMLFAKRIVKEHTKVKLSIILFFFLYSLLFTFWWILSFIYTIFNRDVSWR